jgi:cytochrome c oxidase subunit 4
MAFLNTPVALGIASAKALLVMYFFMELRHSPRINMVVMGSSVIFFGIMVMLTMSDILSRGWLGVPGK